MDPITAMAYEIQQMQIKQDRMILTGVVEAIHAEEGLVDVRIDDLVLEKIPLYTTRAGADKTYWMPSVGEQGTVLSPSGNLANAMFLVGLNSTKNPVPETDPNVVVRVWADGAKESYNKGTHEYIFQINADTLRRMIRGEIEDKVGGSRHVVDSSKVADEVGDSKQTVEATKVKHEVGTNIEELTAIVLNLLGAHLFPNGITTLQSTTGPVFFAPTPTPATAPAPPAGSAPNADGEVTQTPPTRISGVAVQATSNIVITLTAPVPIVTPAGAGTIATGTQIRGTLTGTINLQFPARDL